VRSRLSQVRNLIPAKWANLGHERASEEFIEAIALWLEETFAGVLRGDIDIDSSLIVCYFNGCQYIIYFGHYCVFLPRDMIIIGYEEPGFFDKLQESINKFLDNAEAEDYYFGVEEVETDEEDYEHPPIVYSAIIKDVIIRPQNAVRIRGPPVSFLKGCGPFYRKSGLVFQTNSL